MSKFLKLCSCEFIKIMKKKCPVNPEKCPVNPEKCPIN